MITEARLNEIEARASAISPGPWSATTRVIRDSQGYCIAVAERFDKEQAEVDALFIAHAPTDILDLADEVRRLRQLLGERRETIRYEDIHT